MTVSGSEVAVSPTTASGSDVEQGSEATMAVQQRRDRLMTMRELLESQRETVPSYCMHCGRDTSERDHELLQAALRARIRVLEARVCELEAELAMTS